jgi:hypothetical protein
LENRGVNSLFLPLSFLPLGQHTYNLSILSSGEERHPLIKV